MDLRQLSYFLKIAERRNLTLAASDLNVTQSALTKSLKLLEAELGVTLFHRLPRGVELTEFGSSLVRHAQVMQVQLGDALGELDSLKNGSRGGVSIGAGPAWLRRHLPAAVSKAILHQPDLRIRITGGFDEALLRGLRHGDLDFVVAELPPADTVADLDLEPLTSDRLSVCCRKGHPLTRLAMPSVEDIMPYPWVLPVRATRARRRLDALFLARNLKPPEAAIESGSMAFLLTAIENSDALSYTTRTTVQMPEGRSLVALEIAGLEAERSAGIWTRRSAWLSPATRVVIGELRAVCRDDPSN